MEKKNTLLLISIFAFIISILLFSSFFSELNEDYDCPIYYSECNLYYKGSQKYDLTATIINRTNKEIFIETLTFHASRSNKAYAKYSINNITIQPNEKYYIDDSLVSFGAYSSLETLKSAYPQSAIINGKTYYLKQSSDGTHFGNNNYFILVIAIICIIVSPTCMIIYIIVNKDNIKIYLQNKNATNNEKIIWKIIEDIQNKKEPFNNLNNELAILTYLHKSFKKKIPINNLTFKKYTPLKSKTIYIMNIIHKTSNIQVCSIGIICNNKEDFKIFKLYNNGEIMKCNYSTRFGSIAISKNKIDPQKELQKEFEKYLINYEENVNAE